MSPTGTQVQLSRGAPSTHDRASAPAGSGSAPAHRISAPGSSRRALGTHDPALAGCIAALVTEIQRWRATPQLRRTDFQRQKVRGELPATGFDGHYNEEDGELVFTHVRAPSQAQVREVSARVARRVHRLAIRHSIVDDTGEPLWGSDDLDTIRPEPWVFGWLTQDGDAIAALDRLGGGRESSAEVDGFSIHAGTVVESGDVDGRERLCRYVARPPLADAQLSMARDGRVALRLSRPKRNGATHAFMSPVQLLRRIATLMPRAGQNLIRYAGVLAANSSMRSRVVPTPTAAVRTSSTSTPAARAPRASDIDWARLLRRVYDIDALRCPCGGQMRIIALIEDPVVARGILKHLHLEADAGDPAPARGPPLWSDAP